MAEQEKAKSRRERVGERLKSRYPEREYADDEALFGQIDDDYEAYDKELGEYKERENKLSELFAKDPRNAQFITDMAQGKNPLVAMIKRVGIQGFTDLINDPKKQEEYAKADKEFVERLAKEKELEADYERNVAESMRMLEQMQTERGWSDEQIDAGMELLMKVATDAIVGKFSPENIEMAINMVNRDADMENARSEGEVAGRNAKIEERLRKSQQGDGMPQAGGGNSGMPKKKRRDFFDMVDAAR